MPDYILLWALLGAVAAVVGLAYLNRRARFHQRTIADLTPFFRKLNEEFLQEIFDIERESIAFYHSGNPCRERRRRMELMREYLRRMDHNARIILELANTEYNRMQKWPDAYDDLTRARVITMRQNAALFNHCVLTVLAEIWFWLLLSSFRWFRISVPSAARLRYFGKLDLLQAYGQVKNTTAEYARIFGEEHAEEILASM